MIIEITGGKAGFKEYLETGLKKGRDFHRDEIDQRIPLFGNLEAWAMACESEDAKGIQYDHVTLSFTEDYVSDEMLQKAVDELRDHLYAALPESERYRIPFYAEAHRPKVLMYINSETGELEKRRTHIHVGVGRYDLLTGRRVQLTGYLAQDVSDNIKYLDAFQESFNARHGFTSPKLNPRITPENAIDILARYTGTRPDDLGTFNERKASLETNIQRAIIDQGVTTWAGFEKLLKQFGAVSKVRSGKPNEAYAVVPTGEDRRVRLEGVFFQRAFIELATAEKVSIVQEKARTAYIEQMAPKTEPAYLAATLDEWRRVKAREVFYLHTASDFYKTVYLPASAAERERLLDAIERNTHGVQSPADRRGRQAAPARTRLPKLPVRNLDGVQRRSEMLLRRDDDLDVRAPSAAGPVGPVVRQADGGGTRGRARGPLRQPSSVLARVHDDLLERYERAKGQEKFAEIRRNIDGQHLLARLSHSHGLQPEIYGVAKAADGSTRIVCGSQSVSANDFLTGHLGMRWREAAPILREVYELQLGKRAVRPRSQQDGIDERKLFRAFQASRKDQSALTERLAQFDAQTKAGRAALVARLRTEKAQALAGLGREQRKAVTATETLRAVALKAEYTEARRDERRRLRPPQKEAWRGFLQERAQAGDEVALRVLRGLDDSAREEDGITISGVGLQADADQRRRRALAELEVLKSLQVHVERNGDVTFSKGGRALLRDQGRTLEVLEPDSDEAIVAGLMLAQQMYGRTLTLNGPQSFQARAVALAVERGMPVRFTDPNLERYRAELEQAKRPSRTQPAKPRAPEPTAAPAPAQASEVPQPTPAPAPSAEPELQASTPAPAARSAQPLADAQRALGREVLQVEPGRPYIGNIIDITSDGFAVQRLDRASKLVVIHDLQQLDGRYAKDQLAEIRYTDGRGVDRLQGIQKDQGIDR